MNVTKFVICSGRIESQTRLAAHMFDARMVELVESNLAQLAAGEPSVSARWGNSMSAVVGLGLPQVHEVPVTFLPTALREQWTVTTEKQKHSLRASNFYIKTSHTTQFYHLAGEHSMDPAVRTAQLYGAILRSAGSATSNFQAAQPLHAPSPDKSQWFLKLANDIVASAPAFICNGRLIGSLSEYADCFAMMLFSHVA